MPQSIRDVMTDDVVVMSTTATPNGARYLAAPEVVSVLDAAR
jgi:hypothetical protein